METELIIKLKEGVNLDSIFPATLSNEGPAIKFERLNKLPYSNNETSNTLNKSKLFSNEERETFIQNEILINMDESEKSLYRIFKVQVPSSTNPDELKDSLERNSNVEYVQYNSKNELLDFPNEEPLYAQLYGLNKIQCLDAWQISTGENIIVAVVDSGVDYNHPDLKHNMWKDINGYFGYNFSEDNFDPMDYQSHGTHVAGTIAACMNKFGVVGVAYNAKIMALKTFPRANDTDFHRAIKFAADNGAKVINNSWGPIGRRPSNKLVEDAIDYAVSKGVCVVFAAGNNDDDVMFFSPANYPKVISVGATDENDKKAGFSNYGDLVTVAAPGKNILSCKFKSSEFVIKSGTSMAAPHVSGLAALILAKYPNITLDDLILRLKQKVDTIYSPVRIGTGRINAHKALS
jgi:subtilisin family serine protease